MWAPLLHEKIDYYMINKYRDLLQFVQDISIEINNHCRDIVDYHIDIEGPFVFGGMINDGVKFLDDLVSTMVTNILKPNLLLDIPEILPEFKDLPDSYPEHVEFLNKCKEQLPDLLGEYPTNESIGKFHMNLEKKVRKLNVLNAEWRDGTEAKEKTKTLFTTLLQETFDIPTEVSAVMLANNLNDSDEARLLIEGGWNDFEQFQQGRNLGFKHAKTWSEAQEMGCRDAEEYNMMTNLGWEDLEVMRRMIEMGFSQDESTLVSAVRGIEFFRHLIAWEEEIGSEVLGWIRANQKIIEILNKPGAVPSPALLVLRQKILDSTSPTLRTDRLLEIYRSIPYDTAPGEGIDDDEELENIFEEYFSDIIKVDRTAGHVVKV
jgi:hypothetical protein